MRVNMSVLVGGNPELGHHFMPFLHETSNRINDSGAAERRRAEAVRRIVDEARSITANTGLRVA